MAQVAQGIECPTCTTFTTCSGQYADEKLNGACPCCKAAVSVYNLSYLPGLLDIDALQAENEALRAENASLRSENAKLDPQPEPPVSDEPPAEASANVQA